MLDQYQECHGIVQYNSVIQNSFSDYKFIPSILMRPDINNKWTLALPKVDEKLVLHAQDYLNIVDGVFTELVEIEELYKDQEVVVIHWNHNLKDIYNGPLKLVEFPTHSFEFVQNLKNAQKDWECVNSKTNIKNFMCLNGKLNKHRKLIYNYIKDIPNSVISINDVSNHPLPTYKDYFFDNTSNFINLASVYQMCPVNIVSETLYYTPKGIITEKTLDAFAGLQLPIIIGYKGIIEDIKAHGFDMFDDIIDHSYDSMPDDVRWKHAIDSNMHLLYGEIEYDSLMPRLKKNQQHLLNGYLDLLVSNFVNQSNEVLQGKS